MYIIQTCIDKEREEKQMTNFRRKNIQDFKTCTVPNAVWDCTSKIIASNITGKNT